MDSRSESFPKIRFEIFFQLPLLLHFNGLFDLFPKELIRNFYRGINKRVNSFFFDTT